MNGSHSSFSPNFHTVVEPTSQVTTEAPSKKARKVLAGERLDTLDGMRGLAALMVVLHHFFARWAEPFHETTLYPHGNTVLLKAPVLAIFGEVGVLLFFLVSGFVIMMTLERSTGILDFAGRRIARLWPAMIVCATLSAILINTTDIAGYYGMEWWAVRPFEYVSSIFFLPPDLTGPALGVEGGRLDWVEGVYWTLWHEVRFYALIAVVFLISPRLWFLWAWAIIQAVSTSLDIGMLITGKNYVVGMGVELLFQPRMLAWFSLGLCGYLFWSKRSDRAIPVIAITALIGIASKGFLKVTEGHLTLHPNIVEELLTYGLVVIPFLLFLARSPLLNFLRLPAFVTIGLASYPLYLFHELPGMVGMKIGAELGIPPFLATLLTMGAVIGAAIAIHHLVENPGKRLLTTVWKRLFSGLEARTAWLRY